MNVKVTTMSAQRNWAKGHQNKVIWNLVCLFMYTTVAGTRVWFSNGPEEESVIGAVLRLKVMA